MAAIASRYARALVEVVLEQKIDADIARQQLNSIVEAVHESAELRRVWESPAISAEQKRAVLDAIVGQMGVVKPIRNFIAILIDHRRIAMLDDIARQFEANLNAQLGFAEAEISSARPLSADGKRAVGIAVGAHDRQEGTCALLLQSRAAGRSYGSRGQHDLRRLGARPVGEDAAGAEHRVATGSVIEADANLKVRLLSAEVQRSVGANSLAQHGAAGGVLGCETLNRGRLRDGRS